MLIELCLGDSCSLGEAIVGQLGNYDFVTMLGEVGRFDAARDRMAAVQEEEIHAISRFTCLFHVMSPDQRHGK